MRRERRMREEERGEKRGKEPEEKEKKECMKSSQSVRDNLMPTFSKPLRPSSL
jgi:hypothetical protein